MKTFLATVMILIGSAGAEAAETGVVFRCELTNLRTQRVVQSRETFLTQEPVLWLFGGGGLSGLVRDNPVEDSRELEITMEYRDGASSGRATAWSKYDPLDSKNFEGRLAEASMGMPFPRDSYSLGCFLITK